MILRMAGKTHICRQCAKDIPKGTQYSEVLGSRKGRTVRNRYHKSCWNRQVEKMTYKPKPIPKSKPKTGIPPVGTRVSSVQWIE